MTADPNPLDSLWTPASVNPALEMVLAYMEISAGQNEQRKRIQYPATVTAWDSDAGSATVQIDDGALLSASSLVGPVAVDDRVMVAFERPHGVFIAGRINDPSGAGGGSGQFFDIVDYGAISTPGHDNTAAIQDCIDDAEMSNGIVIATYSLLPYGISGRVFWPANTEHHGYGKNRTRYLCLSDVAGFDFGDQFDGYECGETYGFGIDGDHVALKPLVIGVRVSGIFRDIRSHASIISGDWETTASCWLIGTQNCLFDQCTFEDGLVPMRWDGACATNHFTRCHLRTAYKTFLDVCAINSVPAVGLVPGFNVMQTCILEYDAGCDTFVKHRAGLNNLLTDCVLYITHAGGAFAGDTMVEVTDEYGYGVGFSTIRLRGNLFGITPTGNTVDAVNATFPGWAQIEDGNRYIGWRYALRGFCVISGQQYYAEMGTANFDESGLIYPQVSETASTIYRRPSEGSLVEAYIIDGEDFPRMYRTTNGAMGLGDGTANPTEFLSRTGAGVWQLSGTGLFADLDGGFRLGAATQVSFGDIFGFAGIALGNASDTFLIKSGTSIIGIPKLALSNIAAASTPGTVIGKYEVFDYATGASIGFVPIYNTIT